MLSGFNHNIRHHNVMFHVQTEDCGKANPVIVTHLFVGGNIIATRRSNYGKFIDRPGLQEIVLAMMQEQHKEMLKDLVSNHLRAANEYLLSKGIDPFAPAAGQPAQSAPQKPDPRVDVVHLPKDKPAAPPPKTVPRPHRIPNHPDDETIKPPPVTANSPYSREKVRTFDSDQANTRDKSLDELILDFLNDEDSGKKPS